MKRSSSINYSIIVFLMVLIGAIGISNTIAKNKAKYVWKMANVAPEAAFLAEFMKEEIIQRFERVTDGELSIDMYWGGIMGDEEDYIAKMRIGQLHGC